MDIIPLAFVPDFQLDDEGQIVWEHVVFPLDSGGAVGMTSRVPCAPGLFFPLGWVLLTEAAGGLLIGGRSDGADRIIPVEEPGFGVAGAAFLDTDPFRSQHAGFINAEGGNKWTCFQYFLRLSNLLTVTLIGDLYVCVGCRKLLYDSGYIAASIYSTPEESISSAVDTFASAALESFLPRCVLDMQSWRTGHAHVTLAIIQQYIGCTFGEVDVDQSTPYCIFICCHHHTVVMLVHDVIVSQRVRAAWYVGARRYSGYPGLESVLFD